MSGAAFTWHGGRLADARAVYGDGPEPWIDLSTGINPAPWPCANAIALDWQRLPDPAALAELEAIAARHFGVEPVLCCAVPGSEIGLRLLGQVIELPGRHWAPAYRTHATVCGQAVSIDDIMRPPTTADLLLLANPNNPDGRIIGHAQLDEWRQGQERAGGWLVVDEAFADVSAAISIAPQVDDGSNLIVLRSFGKFFGLAGVRLGFVLAPRAIIARFRQLLGDWPLSAAALAIGFAAYADTAWIAAMRAALIERAARLDAVLHAQGLEPRGACPLFRLIETPDADVLFGQLARHAILTRPFADHPHWLRLGLPSGDVEMARLDRALADG